MKFSLNLLKVGDIEKYKRDVGGGGQHTYNSTDYNKASSDWEDKKKISKKDRHKINLIKDNDTEGKDKDGTNIKGKTKICILG